MEYFILGVLILLLIFKLPTIPTQGNYTDYITYRKAVRFLGITPYSRKAWGALLEDIKVGNIEINTEHTTTASKSYHIYLVWVLAGGTNRQVV